MLFSIILDVTMLRKCCLFGFLFLLLSCTADASVLIVNSEGNGDFSSIQEAVDSAAPGDSIVVTKGQYTENIMITKELVLISNSSRTEDVVVRIKDPDSSIFSVQADNVTIAGFSLHGINNKGYGIWLNGSNGCNLSNNFVSDCRWGIFIEGSYRNIISDNFLDENRGYGVFLVESSNNQIENNTIINQMDGICLDSSYNNFLGNNSVGGCSESGITLRDDSFNNNLSANRMFDNTFNFGDESGLNKVGLSNRVNGKKILYLNNVFDVLIDSSSRAGVVYCYNCVNVTVRDISVSNNLRGISFYNANGVNLYNLSCTHNDKGIYFEEASDSVISNSTIQNNSFVGISLDDSNGFLIEENEIQDNDDGIYTSEAFNCEIRNNLITGSSTGIMMGFSNNNLIKNNEINSNDMGLAFYLSDQNKIDNNEFLENAGYSVFLQYSSDNSIMNNNIVQNDVGIRFKESSINNSVFDNSFSDSDECFVGEEGNNIYNNTYQGVSGDNYLSSFSPMYLIFVIIGAFSVVRSRK